MIAYMLRYRITKLIIVPEIRLFGVIRQCFLYIYIYIYILSIMAYYNIIFKPDLLDNNYELLIIMKY